jgi:hypothetical protein
MGPGGGTTGEQEPRTCWQEGPCLAGVAPPLQDRCRRSAAAGAGAE